MALLLRHVTAGWVREDVIITWLLHHPCRRQSGHLLFSMTVILKKNVYKFLAKIIYKLNIRIVENTELILYFILIFKTIAYWYLIS